ncbi:MAG: ATP-dependent DNA helicase [Candidatus Aenigmarchaeota archaeon]|nr:ATP-dependent DNA helicase [Candidatus Aenigmarchaeota archaeon]
MEKSYTCSLCGRQIKQRGFCLPCNKKRSASKQSTFAPARKIEKQKCESCGFVTYYRFSRCPECDTLAKETVEKPIRSNKNGSNRETIDIDAPTESLIAVQKSSISKFVFPFESVRGPQQEMMYDVAHAVAAGRHLVADAPTGLGKTIAALFPAVEYAVANGKTVFFLTSRLSQHKAAVETLKLMRSNNKFKAVDIVGKKHLCSHDVADMDSGMFNNFCTAMIKDKRCNHFKNSRSGELTTERAGLIRILTNNIPSTEEAMALTSSRYCTYEMLMDAALHADVIVGDYFHIFGMHEKFLKRSAKNLSDAIIIVDEAHNLSSRIRNHLSSRVSTRTCELAMKEAQAFTEYEVKSVVSEISSVISAMGKRLFNKKESFVEREEFIDKIAEISNYDSIVAQLTRVGESVLEEKKISYVDRIAEFLQMWKKEGVGYARIISREKIQDKNHIAIQFSCLDPSLVSREIVRSSHATILMSGTLSPMEMHRDLLGLETERTTMKSYDSPFPKENRKNIIVRGMTTQYKERNEANYIRMARRISDCITAVRGNLAVFFPSYEMRDNLCSMIKTGKHAIFEKSSMTKAQRDEVKNELRSHAQGGAVLMGVMGGSFSEGIDLPGDLLNGVIIVGLPLERPTLSVDALISYYDERFRAGRDYGYNFPAMIKVMQAAGRCIRTETDRGVIVFLDERFLWQNYRRIFPKSWEFTATERPEDEIRRFFS